MPGPWRVTVHGPSGVLMSCALGARPLYVGRAPTNDLALDDDRVSGRHCALSASGEKVFVEDLGSRNGTWLGERRVRRLEPWPATERLRLGAFELALDRSAVPAGGPPALALRDAVSGLLLPLRDGRLRIGGPGADVSVEGGGEVVVQVDPDGQAWVGTPEGALEPLAVGEVVAVGERRYALVATAPEVGATRDAQFTPWPYELRVGMNGPLGPVAEVVHEAQRAVWTAENRVVVWYLLGRKLHDDRKAGLDAESAGWLDEQDVATGVWGRDAAVSNLGVLLTRIRHDLRRAELDPWFLERRRGKLRARVAQVQVTA